MMAVVAVAAAAAEVADGGSDGEWRMVGEGGGAGDSDGG